MRNRRVVRTVVRRRRDVNTRLAATRDKQTRGRKIPRARRAVPIQREQRTVEPTTRVTNGRNYDASNERVTTVPIGEWTSRDETRIRLQLHTDAIPEILGPRSRPRDRTRGCARRHVRGEPCTPGSFRPRKDIRARILVEVSTGDGDLRSARSARAKVRARVRIRPCPLAGADRRRCLESRISREFRRDNIVLTPGDPRTPTPIPDPDGEISVGSPCRSRQSAKCAREKRRDGQSRRGRDSHVTRLNFDAVLP